MKYEEYSYFTQNPSAYWKAMAKMTDSLTRKNYCLGVETLNFDSYIPVS